MGNYSYLEEQVGCVIDSEKVKVVCKLKGNDNALNRSPELSDDNLGSYMDGWKIQGYWYDEFIEFLYICADCMEGLTEKKGEDCILMREEQGFNFIIHFFLCENKPIVEVDFVPMRWETIRFKREQYEKMQTN